MYGNGQQAFPGDLAEGLGLRGIVLDIDRAANVALLVFGRTSGIGGADLAFATVDLGRMMRVGY